MEREIKFKRVFQHEETGRICMKTWGCVDYKGESCSDFSSFVSPASISRWYPITDLQYTGLKDKKGKEIYEGDIVRRYHLQGDVAWHESRACFIVHDGFNEPLYHDILGIEVIGNIYENPNLLE
jgi:uncharacterized phage protein (TIGR01671 family)